MGDPHEVSERLKQNLLRVEERIMAACQKAGRQREETTLVAVTKYVDAAVTKIFAEVYSGPLGESRPQAIWEKQAVLPNRAWHLVGHLQRNKVAKTLPLVQLIHSVDSQRLLQAIEEEASKLNRIKEVLLELHLTKEESKTGFPASEWPRLTEYAEQLKWEKIVGLMGMGPLDSSADDARRAFAQLREWRDQWKSQFHPPHDLEHLSMGMTHDFEQAILEGATIIRIGSALFEGVMA